MGIPRYVYPKEEELPIPHYLTDLDLGIERKGGRKKKTRKYKRSLDDRKNAKRSKRKRKISKRFQKK